MIAPRSFLLQQQHHNHNLRNNNLRNNNHQQHQQPLAIARSPQRHPLLRSDYPSPPRIHRQPAPRSVPGSRPESHARPDVTPLPSSAPLQLSPSSMYPVHSKPMVIPPRSPQHASSPGAQTQTVRARGHHGGRRGRLAVDDAPRSDKIPPAVAALLAVTSIPPPPRRRTARSETRRISIDELMEEWRRDDLRLLSLSPTGSPLDILLERPYDSDGDDAISIECLNEKDRDFLPCRSVSSESIPSMPSLDGDEHSLSSWNEVSTPPSSGRRPHQERKEKVMSSPATEDCILDHPLLRFSLDDCEDIEKLSSPLPSPSSSHTITDHISPETKRSTIRLTSSFKSNLTASIQALKFAAKSFSNFTAPTVPPDDLLTRSLLSPRFTSEMRPKPLTGLPTPALRRYLNPRSAPLTPAEMTKQFYEASTWSDADIPLDAPMIQLQTYDKRGRPIDSSSRKRQDSSSNGSRSLPAVRQREPRENGDFLRVIVLEMNMRREGKLDAKAMGKARIWLPPRKMGTSLRPDTSSVRVDGVPLRWVSIRPGEP